MEKQNLTLTFIGAGNVATHLAQALARKSCRINQIYSRTETSAQALASALDCSFTTDLSEISPDSDLYVVSVKDAVLEEVTGTLARYANPDALFVHTAGSMPMSVWEGKARRHGVLYPMQTFSKSRSADFSNVPFFIETSLPDDTLLLQELAGRLSDKVYAASSEQRKYLHIAAVFACNFANHMYAISRHLLRAHGLPFEAMLPLIDETARKVHTLTPTEAQTGPARRDDRNVMERHLEILEEEPELATLYHLISRNIHTYELKDKEENDKL